MISEIVENVLLFWARRPGGSLRSSAQGGPPIGSAKVKENSESEKFQNFNATFCNPLIFSAMAMAMSIYRTLCVLVFNISTFLHQILFKYSTIFQQIKIQIYLGEIPLPLIALSTVISIKNHNEEKHSSM